MYLRLWWSKSQWDACVVVGEGKGGWRRKGGRRVGVFRRQAANGSPVQVGGLHKCGQSGKCQWRVLIEVKSEEVKQYCATVWGLVCRKRDVKQVLQSEPIGLIAQSGTWVNYWGLSVWGGPVVWWSSGCALGHEKLGYRECVHWGCFLLCSSDGTL